MNGDRDGEWESRFVGTGEDGSDSFSKNKLASRYEVKQAFSDPKMTKIHINYGRIVTMMASKAKAPSWLPPLPGWERSANMEYAEWAPAVGSLLSWAL